MRHFSRRESGQAAVETAIVMPLFVFLMMGLIQLGLAHQARLMTRYAAYKATRVGAIQRAQKSYMRDAALAVLVPMVPDGNAPPKDSGAYSSGWNRLKNNQHSGGPTIVEVTICNPTSATLNENDDFDDPKVASGKGEWAGFLKSRLHVQVTFNYPLIIPFANAMLFWATAGIEPDQYETYNTFRLRNKTADETSRDRWASGGDDLKGFARSGKYYIPIRANWAMRMQSNVAAGQLAGANNCFVNFKRLDRAANTRDVIFKQTGAGQ